MRTPPTDGWTLGRVIVAGLFAIGFAALVIVNPPAMLLATAFGPGAGNAPPRMNASASAFGESGQLRLQVRMPGERFDFPVELGAASVVPEYLWVKAEDSSAVRSEEHTSELQSRQ